ncbi:MAG: hypothetical protein IKW74_07540, partial [Thermoguttaceae bacterium]|nr:hypothetical protein [Thermoguttaceae bacterium]
VSVQSDYVRYPYSLIERQKEWTEIEYQFRNWYHFTWLAGDEILQSLLHNLDSVLWALDERVPVSAYGIGGRSTEEIPEMGDQYDHSAVIYEYDDGLRIYGMDRAARNCVTSNQDIFHGTKGRCYFHATDSPYITDLQNNKIWEPSEPRKRNMYVQEHYDLINSILENKPINNGERMVTSTMTAILGMIATRSGQRVSYQELYDSNFTFGPDEDQFSLDMEPMFGPNADGCYKVAVPGVTKDY